MAFRTQKISQMTPKGSDLEATDLIEVSTIESGSYVTRSITGQELIDAIPAPTGFVPESRTLTINGVTQDLSADRTFTISTGITIGTTAITSGSVGRILFEGAGNVVQQSSQISWNNSTNALTVTTGKTFSAYQSGTVANDALKITVSNDGASLGIQNSNASGFSGVEYLNSSGSPRVFTGFNNSNGQEFRFNNFASGGYIDFLISATSAFRIFNSRNIGIGTTTDAGFRTDINGTLRVQGNVTMTSGTSLTVGSIQIFDDTNGSRVIQTLSNQGLLIRAGGNTVTLSNSAGTGNAVFSTTGVYNFRPNGALAGGGVNISAITTSPSSTTLSFSKLRNDGAKSAKIITEDFAISGSTPLDLFIYAGKETVLNNQANLILCHDGTTARGNTLIGTTANVASAIVNVESTTKGFLPPRMTTTQKNAIASPAAGLMVYDTTLNVISYYNGSMWI